MCGRPIWGCKIEWAECHDKIWSFASVFFNLYVAVCRKLPIDNCLFFCFLALPLVEVLGEGVFNCMILAKMEGIGV